MEDVNVIQELPNELVVCKVVEAACELLQHCKCLDLAQVLACVGHWCSVLLKTWDSWVAFDLSEPSDAKLLFKEFVKVNKSFKLTSIELTPSVMAAHLDTEGVLVNFISAGTRSFKFTRLVGEMVVDFMKNPNRAKQVAECQPFMHELPQSFEYFHKHGATLEKLKLFSDKLRGGSEIVGIVELGHMLAEVGHVRQNARDMFDEPARVKFVFCCTHFCNMLQLYCNKVELSEKSLSEFQAKFGAIFAAVQRWDFRECGWIHEPPKAEDEAAGKLIGQLVPQIQLWLNQGRVFEGFALKQWCEAANQLELPQRILKVLACLDNLKLSVDAAAKTLAHSMLAVPLLERTEKDAKEVEISSTLAFISKVLRVEKNQLDAALIARLAKRGAVVEPNSGVKPEQANGPQKKKLRLGKTNPNQSQLESGGAAADV